MLIIHLSLSRHLPTVEKSGQTEPHPDHHVACDVTGHVADGQSLEAVIGGLGAGHHVASKETAMGGGLAEPTRKAVGKLGAGVAPPRRPQDDYVAEPA